METPTYEEWRADVAVEEPLLGEEKAPSENLARTMFQRTRRRGNVLFHMVLVLVYTSILIASWLYMRGHYSHGPGLTYDPVRSAVRYEKQVFDHSQVFFNHTPKPYSGVPSPEKEAAWDELLRNFNIRVSEDEMRHLGKLEHGLPLPDGGYFGSLTVFHQLHCIWRLQKSLYPKYYWSDLSEDEAFLNLVHSEHCLDVMRQSILCNADTSIMTMRWEEDTPAPIADATNVHECVNWDAINSWAGERVFDPFQPNYLVHPTLGNAFADDRAVRLAVTITGKNKDKGFPSEKVQEILKYTAR